MKELLWHVLVRLISFVPAVLRDQFCRLCFDASSKNEPTKGCKELLMLQEDVVWFLDRCAIRHEGGVHPKHRLMDYHRFFFERVQQNEKVLDIGCGVGAVAYSIAEHGGIVTGIDIDSDNIKKAKEKYNHPRLDFLLGDATKSLPEQSVDVIVLSNVLEHIAKRRELLGEIISRFTPKRFLIRVPMSNRDWIVPFKKELGLPHYCDPDHCIEYTSESFAVEMSEAGLDINEIQINWGEIWAEVIWAGAK